MFIKLTMLMIIILIVTVLLLKSGIHKQIEEKKEKEANLTMTEKNLIVMVLVEMSKIGKAQFFLRQKMKNQNENH